ncbi:MAG: LysR family transcriptional regulator [Isosphaeraceae bacterium]
MRRGTKSADGRHNRLHNLRSFCLAAQYGSISKAAELTSLSQPTVSLQIQSLEQEFQTALFHRRGPKIRLTSDGQALYDLARPLVEGIDALPSALSASRQGLASSRLDIAAGEATILYILPEIIREFAHGHPTVEFRLHNVRGGEGLKLLRNDAVDFAVGSLIGVPDDIAYDPAFSFDPMLITPPGHPLTRLSRVTLKNVSEHPLILPPQHLTTWRVVDYAFRKYHLTHRVVLESGGWEVIKRYVELGLGISIVTGICLTGKESLAAIPFGRYFPKRTYGIVLRKGRLLSPQASQFIELIKSHASQRSAAATSPARPPRPVSIDPEDEPVGDVAATSQDAPTGSHLRPDP